VLHPSPFFAVAMVVEGIVSIEDEAAERFTTVLAADAVIEECVVFGQNSLYPSWSRP
jgi:hypothetical protein